MTQELTWRKSSYSGQNGGDCIEWAVNPSPGSTGPQQDDVLVRDSKNKSGPRFAFSAAAWNGFVTAAVNGEFGDV
ncbi:DUF397 domain-containing protein [Streptomyces cyaneofuscatus]|uniref:DUF397 domain-containing protein n=1 Tax=Streptomyces tropicalis TaxID=3034234 RepID=A0ABT6AES9_9ACTN|nr:DUF397 domain-containing protein [Streptomyces tropicalis]MDF3303144.1 DUF397 domain-containing protein [Streptomyces tropicalis]